MTRESGRRAGPAESEPITETGAGRSSHDQERIPLSQRRVWRPPTDVFETDEHVVVKVEIAGMHVDDLSITFADRRLVVAGRRRDPVGKIVYQNMEIRYGEFRTEVRVGWALDQSAIEATYDAGFLHVYLPKRATEHKVAVRVQPDDE